jgi:hypothetical protein
MEKHLESLNKAIANLKIADHIVYVTYPIMKDKRLLLKALESIYDSFVQAINSVLQYDYLWKRIILYKDSRENFETFKRKCAKRYNISEQELNDLVNFLKIIENHKKSPMEFMRREKIVIMSDNLKTTLIDLEKIKFYLNFARTILSKIQPILARNSLS